MKKTAAFVCVCVSASSALAQPGQRRPPPDGILLVRWSDPDGPRAAGSGVGSVLRALEARVTWTCQEVPGLAIVEMPPERTELARILLGSRSEIEYAERDAWVYPCNEPNDTRYPDQKPVMAQICAQSLWNHTTNAVEPIAVVDSGVRFQGPNAPEPDLVDNIVVNVGEIPGDGIDNDGNGYVDDYWGVEILPSNPNGSTAPDPQDVESHGTEMASIIGARGNNGSKICGVAWKAKLIIVKSTDNVGVGTATSYLKGLKYAVSRGARIVNCSWTFNAFFEGGSNVQAMKDFITATPNTLYVVAAGNDGYNLDSPCLHPLPSQWSLDNMLVVGEVEENDVPVGFVAGPPPPDGPCDAHGGASNYGAHTVHVFAPGYNVYSINDAGNVVPTAGTSDAAAIVSATASFVWTAFPSFDANAVKNRIMNTVDIIPGLSGWCVTGGRVNAARAAGYDSCP